MNKNKPVVEVGEPLNYFENYNLDNIVTLIRIDKFKKLLEESHYPQEKIDFLVDGFMNGFDIGYAGTEERTDLSDNIPLKIGDATVLWNTIMKEVKAKRYAGPFEKIPFENYMQSPVGLVPKLENRARLIFHLSYEFKSSLGSLNANTPKHECSVKYRDLDHAIQSCIQLMKDFGENQPIFFAKSDLVSASCILPLKIANFKWLVIKAIDPISGEIQYFVNNSLPFGASISCALFQEFSDALQHITQFAINKNRSQVLTNYLDDFLFITISLEVCNQRILIFMNICKKLDARFH